MTPPPPQQQQRRRRPPPLTPGVQALVGHRRDVGKKKRSTTPPPVPTADDRRRQIKGLGQAGHYYRKSQTPLTKRGIITPEWRARGRASKCCKWCGERITESREHWHKFCAMAYTAATGATAMMGNEKLIDVSRCRKCASTRDIETDHIISLAVALVEGVGAYIRAHRLDNLQPLCQRCHRAKSRQDSVELEYAIDRVNRQLTLPL